MRAHSAIAAALLSLFCCCTTFAANVMQTFFVPIPENDMMTTLNVINQYGGAIGDVMRATISIVAGNDGTTIYFDHWEDGYEADITAPTQSTTQVWGDGNPANGIPSGYATDAVDAGSIINLETSMDVTRSAVTIEYDGRDKVGVTKPVTMARAMYPLAPGEVIAEAGVALDISQHGTEYVAPFGVTNSLGPYTNEVFEYTSMYIMADYDFTIVEVDRDNDGIFETTRMLNQGETLFINGGVKMGARARGNKPFQLHFVTGDIGSNYETRWYTAWPLDAWFSDYFCPVGTRAGYNGYVYKSLAVFYNASNSPMTVFYETALSTGSITVAANSQSQAFVMPTNSGARFYTTNAFAFSASCIFDGTAPGQAGQLQDYDWGFTMIPRDALSTMGIVGWGPGQGVSGGGTSNGSPVWVTAESNTTLYVDLDGDPSTGRFTNSQGRAYDYATNMVKYQTIQIADPSDTNQSGVTFYTLDNTRVGAAWGVDPARAGSGLPYLDAGYEVLPFPTIMAQKFATLFNDFNGNGYPDPGDTLEFIVDVINVGFAAANNVIFRDELPTNITYYATNSASLNGAGLSDDLPPKLTRFPFDETGCNIGSIGIGQTSTVRYVTGISTSLPAGYDGYIHNNATVGGTNGNWGTLGFTNIIFGGLDIFKTSSTTNLLAPGTNYTYTIIVANTGSVTYTGLTLEDTLSLGISYVPNSTVIQYPFTLTNTWADRFDLRSYASSDGTLPWLTNWTEDGESDGFNAGDLQVRMDAGTTPGETYALGIFANSNSVTRAANLSGHAAATLSFSYRREGLDDANDYVDVLISSNNWASFATLRRFQGAGTDGAYGSTNFDITAYISTSTSFRLQSGPSTNMIAADGVWFDSFIVSAKGSNTTFAGDAPPVLFENYTLPPGTSVVVTFRVTVDNPPTEQVLPNVARARAIQHEPWVYPAPVTNYVNATRGVTLSKTASPAGVVGPGSNIQYTISIVNTGDLAQTGISLQDLLPVGVTYVPGSASLWRPFAHTNTAEDYFETKTYTNSNGTVDWLGPWTEIGDNSDSESGNISVGVDNGTSPGRVYALLTTFTGAIQRAVNLSGYTNAQVQLDYRRQGLDGSTDYMAVLASSNNGASFQQLGTIGGATNDGQYFTATFNLSASISTNTIIRLAGSAARAADDQIWVDDVRVLFWSANATNRLRDPPVLLNGYILPPRTSMTVQLNAMVNDPAAATEMINTAVLTSDQQPNALYAHVTNTQPGTVGMTISKTSDVTGAWGLFQTNTYVITLINTGTVTQTGTALNDVLPPGVSVVSGSVRIVAAVQTTNYVPIGVTTSAVTETVADEFDTVSYANNNGTVNWLNSWDESESNPDDPVNGSTRVEVDTGTTNSLVFRDTGADNDFITRTAPIVALAGVSYTGVVLNFAYRRRSWDATDSFDIHVSTNGFAGQSNLVWNVGGNAGATDAGYIAVSTNITARMGTNLSIRLRGGPNFQDGDMFHVNYLNFVLTGLRRTTNYVATYGSTVITNAGSDPATLLSGYTFLPGSTNRITLRATLNVPLSSTQFVNTATVTSIQQPARSAFATNFAVIGAVGDFVWHDINTNGVQNGGETGLSGVTVRLYGAATNLLASTVTDATGYYLFNGWPTGTYLIGFTTPTNYFLSARDQGGDDTLDSDPNPATGFTGAFPISPGTNRTIDAGMYVPSSSIGNYIWLDANTNGIQDGGESPATGVVVRLYNSFSNLLSVATNNASGNYLFTGLPPGDYFLEFVIPSNYVFALANQGGNDAADSDADQITGRTAIFSLPSGVTDNSWDAGLVLPVSGLRISKTSSSGGSCWVPGATSSYTIVIINTGAVRQAGISVTDPLPPGLTYVASSVVVRAPSSGVTGSPPALASGFALLSGQAMTVTVSAVVNKPGTVTTLANTAYVASAIQPTLNASVTDCVASSDLAVEKTVSDDEPSTTQIIEYRLTVTNRGPSEATAVTVDELLPSYLQYNSSSNGTYSYISHTWDIGTLPAYSSTSLWISVTVRTNANHLVVTNTACIAYADQFDPVSTNNCGSVVIRPTLVFVSRFEARSLGGQAVLEWETSYEMSTIGFHLYRIEPGIGPVRINTDLLPSVIGAPQGGIYRFADPAARPGREAVYVLEEVEAGGGINQYGPFTVSFPASAKRATSRASFSAAIRTSPDTLQRHEARRTARASAPVKSAPAQRGGSLGDWPALKLQTHRQGIHYVSAEELAGALGAAAAEVSAAITGRQVALRSGGEPVAALPAEDGAGFYFYADRFTSIYATNNAWFISWEPQMSMTAVTSTVPAEADYSQSGWATLHEEKNVWSWIGILHDPEEDYYFWAALAAYGETPVSTTITFTAENPAGWIPEDPSRSSARKAADSSPADPVLAIRLRSGSTTGADNEHHVKIFLNGVELKDLVWSGIQLQHPVIPFRQNLLQPTNNLQIVAYRGPGISHSLIYMDYFELTYLKDFAAGGNQAEIAVGARNDATVRGFSTNAILAMNVTIPHVPVLELGLDIHDYEGGFAVSFAASPQSKFALCVPDQAYRVQSIEVSAPADLLAETNAADHVIIAPRELAAAAQILADHRATAGLVSRVIVLEDIYDVFASGRVYPPAIRDFLRYTGKSWARAPRYVLLAGEGTTDYRNSTGAGDSLVPVMMVDVPSVSLFASDNWFADFDEDLVPDMAIGRLPAVSSAELQNMISKIIAYETGEGGNWLQTVMLAADNKDGGGNFEASCDSIAGRLPADYGSLPVYLAAEGTSGARTKLQGGLNSGAGFVTYFGHGGMDTLAVEGMLTKADAYSLTNAQRASVVVALTCAAGQFPVPGYDCLSEALVLNPTGGAVAVWAPVGSSFNTSARMLAEEFFNAIFRNGAATPGDAVREALDQYVRHGTLLQMARIYNLLGDPALRLRGAAFLQSGMSWENWRNCVFTAAEKSDPMTGEEYADADGDGLCTLEEYLFGKNPHRADSEGDPVIFENAGPERGLMLGYQRRRHVDGSSFHAEVSSDLYTWEEDEAYIAETEVTDDGNGVSETVRMRMNPPAGYTPATFFLRLRLGL